MKIGIPWRVVDNNSEKPNKVDILLIIIEFVSLLFLTWLCGLFIKTSLCLGVNKFAMVSLFIITILYENLVVWGNFCEELKKLANFMLNRKKEKKSKNGKKEV